MKKRRRGRGQSRRAPLRKVLPAVILVVTLILVVTILRDRGSQNRRSDKIQAVKSAAKAKEPPLPDTVSVGFYNVENLFDFNLDGTEYDEFKPGWFGWTEDVYRTRLNNVSQVVAAVGVDIIGLCEIENMNALGELQASLDRAGTPYPYAAAAEAEKSATVTAVLSKFPIREKRAHAVPGVTTRAILEVMVSRGGDTLVLFVNHWPSKRNPESARLKTAEVLSERIGALTRASPGIDYLILGDFNANYDEFATFHTSGFNDTRGRTGINHALKTIVYDDEQRRRLPVPRFVCKGEMVAADCIDCHYNLWLELDEGERMSYVFRGAKNTLDHIIVPVSMFDGRGYSYLDGSFEVFSWDGRLMLDGAPYRWQMNFRGKQRYHVGRGYSDHLPVRAKIVRAGAAAGAGRCDAVDPRLREGDFAVTVDGWVSGDSRFTVARDNRFARTGTHSLRVGGRHDAENRTAARVRLQPSGQSPRAVSMSIRGSGKLSIRLRRSGGKWVNYSAPDFKESKSARYRDVWRANSWVDLKFSVPPSPTGGDVELELRAGKGEPFAFWIDRVRLE